MIGKLHIQTVYKNGKTYLDQNYFTPPFKTANITEDKRSEWLHLMIMNSSPGILDEDDYEIKIRLAENSSLQLHTQAYQRLFNMKKGATQLMKIHLSAGSSFVYLPHPSVPHENSIFTAKNKIYLSNDCNLIWGEVLTCGRKLNGEIFQFSKYHCITEVFLSDKLIIKENLLMQPSFIDPGMMGQLEGFTHQATLICLANHIITDRLNKVHDYLSYQKEILFGITSTAGNGLLIRILGHKAEQLYHHLHAITSLLQQQKTIPITKPVYAS
jgi:urease accessory protein